MKVMKRAANTMDLSRILSSPAPTEAIEKAAHIITGGGSAVAVSSGVAGLTVAGHDLIWGIGVICGSIAAIGGLAVSWYYKREDNKRKDAIFRMEEKEHGIRLKDLEKKPPVYG